MADNRDNGGYRADDDPTDPSQPAQDPANSPDSPSSPNSPGSPDSHGPTEPPHLPPVPESEVYDADFEGGSAYTNPHVPGGPHDPGNPDAPRPGTPGPRTTRDRSLPRPGHLYAEPAVAYDRPPAWKYILAFGAIMAGVAVVPVAVILRGLPGLAIGAALAAGLIIRAPGG